MSRHNSTSVKTEGYFAWGIILLCLYWPHRILIDKIFKIVAIVFVVGLPVLILIRLIVLRSYFKHRKYLGSSDLSSIDGMSGLEFEKYVAKLLSKLGYTSIKLTEEYDYGVDIIATKDGIKWGIQVKRYSYIVKAEAVRQVVTALKKYNCDRAMVITNNYYSQTAKELARVNSCRLIDRESLDLLSSQVR